VLDPFHPWRVAARKLWERLENNIGERQ